MKAIFFLSLILVSGLVVCNYSQERLAAGNEYKTRLSLQSAGGELNITGLFENNTGEDMSVSYLLVANKTGKSGSASTSQSGTVEADSYKSSVLSTVKINAGKNDSYKFLLTTFNNEKEIGCDSVLYNMK